MRHDGDITYLRIEFFVAGPKKNYWTPFGEGFWPGIITDYQKTTGLTWPGQHRAKPWVRYIRWVDDGFGWPESELAAAREGLAILRRLNPKYQFRIVRARVALRRDVLDDGEILVTGS